MSNNAPTGSIEIQGTLFRGETLTAVSTLDDADGLGLSPISGTEMAWPLRGRP